MPPQKRSDENTYGGYGITVITPVCGTGYPGSIPGSRPNEKKTKMSPKQGTFWF